MQATKPVDVSFVHVETSNRVRWLTLNQPDRRNPLSLLMLEALADAFAEAAEDPEVRAVVLSARGAVFSAGHDLKEMKRHENESLETQQERIRGILNVCSKLMLSIVHSPKAVIACVEGTATAAGCQLVAACDLAIAANTAEFCTPGVNLGAFCTTPLINLGRTIHRKHAMAMALTGEAITAEKAESIGLINEAVSPDFVIERCKQIAEHIASRSTEGIRLGKADFYRQIEMPIEEAFSFANETMIRAMTSADAEEGKSAFFEKRDPQWDEV
jgi:enoyl-CoA hydratase/carnithine racemase